MTAREYLEQAYHLDQRVKSMVEQIDGLRNLAEIMHGAAGGDVVAHSRNLAANENAIIRLVEAEEELNERINELVKLKLEIQSVIDKVDDDDERLILVKRYLCYSSWGKIASEFRRTRRWALYKHRDALQKVDRILGEVIA